MLFFLTILLGLVPSFAWLVFYLHEDFKHPEPKELIFYTFLIGGAATFLVLPLQVVINYWTKMLNLASYSPISLLLLAASEEIFKFAVVYFGVSRRREFDEPLDAMIYMITAALGFAAVENVASVFQATNGLETTALRFVGATLLHSVTSGVVGYYWARAMLLKRNFSGMIVTGLFAAIALHTIFNYLIIKTGPIAFSVIFLVFAGYFLLADFEEIKKYD